MPVGNEVFAGDRHDSTTLEERIRHIERLHGRGAAPLGAGSRHGRRRERGVSQARRAALDCRHAEVHAEALGTRVAVPGLACGR